MQKTNIYVRFAYIGIYYDLMRYIPFGSVIFNRSHLRELFKNSVEYPGVVYKDPANQPMHSR